MLTFNELQINPETGCLVIDVSILDLEAFEGAYITGIYIDNQDSYIPSGISSNPYIAFEAEDGDTTTKHKRIVIKPSSMNPYDQTIYRENDIFFVYVTTYVDYTTHHLTQPLECGYDNTLYMGVVYNQKYLYDKSINYLSELDKCCKIPTYLIDWILRLKAFEIALKTCNYELAIDYWKDIISGDINQNTNNDHECKCYK